jgi:predicted enzyme related to lactoylglutathione lyase
MSGMNNHEAGAVLFTINLISLADFYERVAGMARVRTEADHIVLVKGRFQLSVHQIPEPYASNIKITIPPAVRETSAVKLAFHVADIERARQTANQFGGAIHPPEREWHYEGMKVCDGHDPDGNQFQIFTSSHNGDS